MKDETFDKALDEEAIHYYLWNMCVPSPYSIFKRTKKLEAGEYLELNISDFSYEKRKWWDINTEYYIGEQSDKWVDKVEKDLIDAVKIRLEADVPVGIFLSGGIDSSLVAAIASRLKKGDVDTFSIGFNEKEFDEACYAEDIAKHLGTRHYSLYCSISEAKELISEIPKAYSEPFADNSQIPMMLLSKLTKDYVTVSLSGDGGDEFFWGYPNVIDAAKLFNNRAVSRMFHSFTLPYSRFLKKSIFSHKTWKIKKLCNATSARNIGNLDYVTAYDLIESILSSDYGKEKKTFWDNGIIGNLGKMFDCCHSESDFIKVYMLRDIVVGLEGDMLAKVDRATMYYSIEARCPLLDCHVIEDSFKIPLDVKYRNNTLKYVLKNILYRYIPRELVDRPKHGFGIPINKWLHEKEFMNGFEKYFASEYLEEQGIFSIEGILKFKAAFDRNAGPMVDRVMWTYIVFQMWWEEYMA
jgi:asparagine synthase (glutamine-hydrolysing)